MADGRGRSREARSYDTGRLEAFSDGVFAIAITLLVLDLAVGDSGSALHRLGHAWPDLIAYVVSFLTIGGAWLLHNAMTSRLDRADLNLLRLNLLLLLTISFLPFPTRLVAASLHDAESERVYVTIYGLTLVAIRLAGYLLDEYARRESLYAAEPDATGPAAPSAGAGDTHDRAADDELIDQRRRFWGTVAVYALAIAFGLVLPRAAVGFYAVIGVYLVVPFRQVGRLLFHRP